MLVCTLLCMTRLNPPPFTNPILLMISKYNTQIYEIILLFFVWNKGKGICYSLEHKYFIQNIFSDLEAVCWPALCGFSVRYEKSVLFCITQ